MNSSAGNQKFPLGLGSAGAVVLLAFGAVSIGVLLSMNVRIPLAKLLYAPDVTLFPVSPLELSEVNYFGLWYTS